MSEPILPFSDRRRKAIKAGWTFGIYGSASWPTWNAPSGYRSLTLPDNPGANMFTGKKASKKQKREDEA
jgi:hypothetical protein